HDPQQSLVRSWKNLREGEKNRRGGALRFVDHEAIETRIASPYPIVRSVILYGESGQHRAIKRMLPGINDYAYVALPHDQVAGLRLLHSPEMVDAGKDGSGCGKLVEESGMHVNGMDKVGAVRFRNQPSSKLPSRLNNGVAFLGIDLSKLRVCRLRLSRHRKTNG